VKELPAASAVACPVCKEATTQIYLDQEDLALDVSTIGSSRQHISAGRILRCRSCRFGFRQMRSSPEQLRELYCQMDPTVYQSELRGRSRTAKSHLQIVRHHLGSGRLLDVGCASGLFLLQASRAGWKVTGIEPNEALCEDARKNLNAAGEVQRTTLEMACLQSGFDAITVWDVLEHVPDPQAFMQICRSLLRAGGYLFLNVPDLDSWPARILGPRWPLLLPEHLNYFNRESLTFCAERAALRPVQFGQRVAWFSLKYVAYRLSQHGLPGSRLLRKAAEGLLADALIPIWLGELFAVLRTS
jgi:SAM-dependent methyltransferase